MVISVFARTSQQNLSTQVTNFCQERTNDKLYIFRKITIRPIDRNQNKDILTYTNEVIINLVSF